MKPKRSFEPHLVIQRVTLAPGSEWKNPCTGWLFVHVSSGVGYWLHPRKNHEVVEGTVLVFSDRTQGVARSSQIGPLVLDYFRVQPDRLGGLVSWGEQQFLQNAASQDLFAARLFAPATSLSQKFRELTATAGSNTFPQRLQLLSLFVQAFGEELACHKSNPTPPADATARLVQLLNETAPSELLDLTFADLIRETRCTPRHLSRIFHQVMGMSFREKQAQVRLMRAQELLATTESKVVEVALESGYQSLSLFNLMFKRRFGTTPAKWRDQTKNRTVSRNGGNTERILRA